MTQSIILISIFTLAGLASAGGQQNINTMPIASNPLLCAPETGICEVPGDAAAPSDAPEKAVEKPIKIYYFTDPICSSCWGIEPQLRRLKLEYGANFEIAYHMGGLLPDWSYNSGGISKPSDVAQHWDEVSGHYDMPIDGDVWLEDPLHSSFPPSIAFKAAQLQDQALALRFLRRVREMVFLEKKNITKWPHLQQAAAEVGLDTALLRADFEGRAEQAFQEDLALARSLGVRGFPTLFFTDANGDRITVYGAKPYDAFAGALLRLCPTAEKANIATDLDSLLAHYPTLTAKEYALLSGLPREAAEEALDALHAQGLLHKTSTKNGALWRR